MIVYVEPLNEECRCKNCKHFYLDGFCGYSAMSCTIHGCLELGQTYQETVKFGEECRDFELENK